MDILSGPKIVDFLKTLEPDWRVDQIPMKFFGHGLDAIAHGMARDQRKLLVEVLKSVKGLDAHDLAATDEVQYAGVTFKVLDPIALLKSKAANVRDLDQVGPPPRHDVPHLHLISRCVPIYLRRAHEFATGNDAAIRGAAATFSRAFDALTNHKTRKGLARAGIEPISLVPPEFAESPIQAIRNAYDHQLPRVRGEKRSYGRRNLN
jgi:hypothetical protein